MGGKLKLSILQQFNLSWAHKNVNSIQPGKITGYQKKIHKNNKKAYKKECHFFIALLHRKSTINYTFFYRRIYTILDYN